MESSALVCGNCFQDSVGGLTPSPNLYRFDKGGSSLVDLQTIEESRADPDRGQLEAGRLVLLPRGVRPDVAYARLLLV